MSKKQAYIFAIIVAAGTGQRAGGPIAKQWRMIAGQRVIDWTFAAFDAHAKVDAVIVVTSDHTQPLPKNAHLAAGGETRAKSVRNGLDLAGEMGADIVLIHDAARPCVSAETITLCIGALEKSHGAAPGLAITDAIWQADCNVVTNTVPRNNLFRAQTPQAFHLHAIKTAHETAMGTETDDVEVALAAGLDVQIVPGDIRNIKITHPQDFELAKYYVAKR